jgi:quercetin dioxygenase-like cupin family protein
MNIRNSFCLFAAVLLSLASMAAAAPIEKLRNEKVMVVELTLAPGETVSKSADRLGVLVYLDDGEIEATSAIGKPGTEIVKRGQAVFRPPQSATVKNVGSSDLRIVAVEFLGKGGSETWGTAGLAPNYKLLFENQYGRVYNIKIAAGKTEPLHSHKDRIVICLSGAQLEHEMPDGSREAATLKTGEIAWRRGVTHIGHNIGNTDLWAIAIEPK